MLEKAIIILLFLLTKCQEKDRIIGIPLNEEDKQCIETDNGFLNYQFKTYREKSFSYSIICSDYIIENMKNLDLYDQKRNIEGKNKNIIHFSFDIDIWVESTSPNLLLCDLFYQTKYIDKKILSICNNFENKPFKFFGGTPQDLIYEQNLQKFTFGINDTISEVELIFDWKANYNKYNIKLNSANQKNIEFKDDTHLICLSHEIFSEFKQLLFNDYKKCKYKYDSNYNEYQMFDLNDAQRIKFPELKFKIGNKIITLNKIDLIYEDSVITKKGGHKYEDIHNYLLIKNTPCQNNVFGLKFLEKFKIREYNLETKEINLYLEKDKNFIINERDTKLKLNSYTNFAFLILLSIVFVSIIMLFTNPPKKEYYDYINNNYDI